jgi:hypothetical protein
LPVALRGGGFWPMKLEARHYAEAEPILREALNSYQKNIPKAGGDT